MSHHPHGGPWPVEELQRRYPEIQGVALELRRKCVASPLFLMADILCGSREVNLLKTPSDGHREVEKAMLAFENTLYVDHRGTLKTTVRDEGGSVWQFLYDPDWRILFLQSNIENAKMMSRQVRGHFVRNKALRALFPEYAIDHGDDGAVLAWSVPCKQLVSLEQSFTIATPGISTTGLHFDSILASDLMNPETVPPPTGRATLETMKAIIAWYATTDGLLVTKKINPKAYRSIDSNRWHDGDHVGQILRDDPKQPEEGGYFRKIVRGVKRGADGKFIPTWPEGIPSEELHAIYSRPTMTESIWASNYASDPRPEGGMAFKREAIHSYGPKGSTKICQCGERHRLPEDLDVAITVDPAFTDKRELKLYGSDRSAIVASGVSKADKKLYVLDTIEGRWGVPDLVERIFGACSIWDPQWLGIEENNPAGKALIQIFVNEMCRSNRMVPYRPIRMPGTINKTSSKEVRMMPLKAHVESVQAWGGLYVHEDGRHASLVEELVRFGTAEHDDLADALGMRAVDLWASRPEEKQAERPVLKMVPKWTPPPRRRMASSRHGWDAAKRIG